MRPNMTCLDTNGHPQSGIENLMPWRFNKPSRLAPYGRQLALAFVHRSPVHRARHRVRAASMALPHDQSERSLTTDGLMVTLNILNPRPACDHARNFPPGCVPARNKHR